MARKNVLVMPMYKYYRRAPKSEFLGWGYIATRKATTTATSPRLLAYRSCIAGELVNKKFGSLKSVQEAFKAAANKCKAEASRKPTIEKVRKVLSL